MCPLSEVAELFVVVAVAVAVALAVAADNNDMIVIITMLDAR